MNVNDTSNQQLLENGKDKFYISSQETIATMCTSLNSRRISNTEELEARLLHGMTKNGWTQESLKYVFSILKSLLIGLKVPSFSKFKKKHCNVETSIKHHFVCPTCDMNEQ